MKKYEELSNLLVDKLTSAKPGYVFEIIVPVLPEERLLLQGCKECFFYQTNVCSSIECWGRLSNVIFKVA